jgi:crotonobetainyl-CoA:carnitine CoA-transferase CaiB-like acyl-CoA transferase
MALLVATGSRRKRINVEAPEMTAPPLAGIKILDFTRHMAGPYATVFLADYGADVIKIESLPDGDASRTTGERVSGRVSATYLMWNRGKRSMALNLRKPEAQKIIQRLVETADVVIENYKPGMAEKIGIGYDALAAINPTLLYVSISAFGRGPLEPFPGTDPVVQAMSGVMSVTGEVDGGPVLVGIPVADFTAAMTGAQAVMLGLLSRAQTGRGQRIEVSMLHAMLTALTTRLATYWATDKDPQRNGGAHSVVMPYQVWRTADGYVVAGVWNGGNVMWPLFCEAVELPELAQRPEFATNADRLARRKDLAPIIQAQFTTRPSAYWEARFRARKVLFSPVYTFREILNHPHVVQAGIEGSLHHPLLGETPQIMPPIVMSASPGGLGRHAPLLGEHSREILQEAGFSAAEIGELISTNIVAEAAPA